MNLIARRHALAAALGLATFAAVPAHAAPVVLDFESFNLGGATFLDTPETLNFTNVGGSGVNLQINGGDDVRIYDLALFAGSYAGPGRQALIDMNWRNYNNPSGTDLVFSAAVSNFSLIAGDFGSDDDSPLRIEAFDENGASLGVATSVWGASAFPPFAQLSLNVAGIRRVHYSSGGFFRSSTFIDDIRFEAGGTPPGPTPASAPASLALALLGLGLLGAQRRRRA